MDPMKPRITRFALAALVVATLTGGALAAGGAKAPRVKTANGVVEGTVETGSGVLAFRGVPFAQPPVGDLRWKPPQPARNWQGVRQAAQFGPRCMQHAVFGDMNFRSNGMSEDCLYLNVWAPAKPGKKKLPVLVYFYGGGFVAGDGSEPRYDGESMAREGIVAITVNYRLGVFGFFAHPELTGESPHKASGNYGLLDQSAALRWVRENIAAFGGDPAKITIAGESAGSASVSAQMASPLSKDLIAGAIGESGAMLSTLGGVPLAQAEKAGSDFAKAVGASSLAALRAMSTEQIHEATRAAGFGRFPLTVDGYFLTEPPAATFAAGKQARVPLLVGWNSEEMTWRFLLQGQNPTPANYEKAVRNLYGANADEVLKLYPGGTEEEVIASATDLAGDRFIAYGTWKWADVHGRTGGKSVYRYFYARPRPPMVPAMGDAAPGLAGGVVRGQNAMAMPPARGAVHSAEIEYAMGNLATNKVFAWTPDDFKVSDVMQGYFANFIKTGDPNGPGLPAWPAANAGDAVKFMRIDVKSGAEPDRYRERYLLLDRLEAATPK
jgi:para-nitrobenzyl esterase